MPTTAGTPAPTTDPGLLEAVSRAALAAGAVPGAVLGGVFGAVAKVRRTKPLHPRGRMGRGVLHVTGPLPWLGIPLLATAGESPCSLRWSRATGLPAPLPDVEGLAVRFESGGDLLFASTGTGSLTRFVLAPRAPHSHGPQSTLLPVESRMGSVLFLVEPAGPDSPPRRFDLSVAQGGSSWLPVGWFEVDAWGDDEPVRFDPVRNPLPGLRQYPVVRGLREPAYLMARRSASP